jgi:hypothetical protein
MEIGGRHNILPLLPSLIAAAASSPLTVTGLPTIPSLCPICPRP